MSFLQQLFRRYENNGNNSEENKLVDGWYAFYDREQDVNLAPAETADIEASIWRKITATMQEQPEVHRLPVRHNILRYTGIAAAVLVLLAGSWLWHRQAGSSNHVLASAYYTAGAGITKKIQLPDGSTLLLRPGTTISVDAAFNSTGRNIQVHNGELFCEIAPNSQLPFIAHTSQLDIQVLGTSFAVRAVAGIREQKVVVESGKVQVLKEGKAVGTLAAGTYLAYDTATGKTDIRYNKGMLAAQLRKGWLVLDNNTLGDLQLLLQGRYRVTLLDPAQKLLQAHFSAAFPPETSVQDILRVLCAIHNVHYTITGKTIHIY